MVTLQKYSWQTDRLESESGIDPCKNDILNDMLGNRKAETTGRR